MIEDKDTAIDNINFNKTFRCNIISCKNQTPHTHRFGIEPCVQSTSEELRKRNEIQTDEDLYKNIYREDFLYEGSKKQNFRTCGASEAKIRVFLFSWVKFSKIELFFWEKSP